MFCRLSAIWSVSPTARTSLMAAEHGYSPSIAITNRRILWANEGIAISSSCDCDTCSDQRAAWRSTTQMSQALTEATVRAELRRRASPSPFLQHAATASAGFRSAAAALAFAGTPVNAATTAGITAATMACGHVPRIEPRALCMLRTQPDPNPCVRSSNRSSWTWTAADLRRCRRSRKCYAAEQAVETSFGSSRAEVVL